MSEMTMELWQWLYEPVQQLKEQTRDKPELTWEERLPEFLDALDTHVYALVERVAAEYPDGGGDAEYTEQTHNEAEAQPDVVRPTVERVVDQAVREVALPVLTEVGTGWPHLLAGVPTAALTETVSRLVATRLASA
jgi:hypothetical protein